VSVAFVLIGKIMPHHHPRSWKHIDDASRVHFMQRSNRRWVVQEGVGDADVVLLGPSLANCPGGCQCHIARCVTKPCSRFTILVQGFSVCGHSRITACVLHSPAP
jgi:hypothetical protein